MSILSSTNSGSFYWTNPIKEWCKKHNINAYSLEQVQGDVPFVINVNGNVNLCGYEETVLPDFIVFNEIIDGNFIASYSELTSMKGFPKKIRGNLDISFSNLTLLDDAPEKVGKDFVALGLPFTEQQIREKSKVTRKVFCG